MEQEEYSIHELARLAEVSSRTIRYYAQEGLLPDPVSRGKYAYYTREHLDRLKLIRQLKDAYLPLREIRQTMASLSWQEVREMLAGKPIPVGAAGDSPQPPPVPPPAHSSDSAFNYITRLLQSQSERRIQEGPRTLPPSPANRGSPVPGLSGPPPESWRRILLAPGVELHIKEPYTPQNRDRFEELIQFARKLFSKEPL